MFASRLLTARNGSPRRRLTLSLAAGAVALTGTLLPVATATAGPFTESLRWSNGGTAVAAGPATAGPTIAQQPAPYADGACLPAPMAETPCATGSCVSGTCDSGTCDSGTCGPGGCGTGGCGTGIAGGAVACGDQKVKRFSSEWYQQRAHLPPGERQKGKFGKIWPTQPRPDLPRQPFIHRYHSAQAWPYPYVCADRAAVLATVDMTRRAGYDDLITMHTYHFDPSTGRLNSAGRSRLFRIITGIDSTVGMPRVYVARSTGGVEDRMAVVEQAVVEMAGSSDQIAVLPREVISVTRPSNEVERTYQQRLQTMPAPQLPSVAGGAGGGAAAATPQ